MNATRFVPIVDKQIPRSPPLLRPCSSNNARLQLIYSFHPIALSTNPTFLSFFPRISNSQQEHKLRVAISAHLHVWPQKLAIWQALTSFAPRYNRRRSTETKSATNKSDIWSKFNNDFDAFVGLIKTDDER
jgi:hypothetical protein